MFSSHSKRPIHILLRYSDKLNAAAETIPEHQKVISKSGAVWFGKLGRPVSINHVDKINKQIADGIPSFLYLVQRVGRNYETYCGTIVQITKNCPKDERELIPAYYYYKDIVDEIALWTKLSKIELVDQAALNKLVVATSGMPVLESLSSSMAAHFIVRAAPVFE